MKRTMCFNQMMGHAYSLYGRGFFPLLGYSLVSSFLLMVCIGFLAFPLSLLFLLFSALSNGNPFIDGGYTWMNATLTTVALLLAIGWLCLYKAQGCGFYRMVEQDMNGRKCGFGDMFVCLFQRVFPMLSIGAALFLCYLLPVGVFTAIFVFLVRWTEQGSALRIALLIAWGLLAAACVIFLAIRCLFAFLAGAVEKKYFIKGLIRSFQLTRGVFWELLFQQIGSLLSFAGLYMCLSAIVAILQAVLVLVPGFSTGEGDMTQMVMNQAILALIQTVLSLIALPIPSLFTAHQYYNRRFILEGYDFELNLRALEGTPPLRQPESIVANGLPYWATPPAGEDVE